MNISLRSTLMNGFANPFASPFLYAFISNNKITIFFNIVVDEPFLLGYPNSCNRLYLTKKSRREIYYNFTLH